VRAVVVGGGIAGLAAAWVLADRGADVTVLEASPRVGGKLRLAEVAGVAVDVGAESMLVRRPEGLALARAAGLGEQLVAPSTLAARIWAGGTSYPLPPATVMGIPTDLAATRASGLLDAGAIQRLEAEPSLPPLPPLRADVAVGGLVRQRCGDAVADRLVDPMLAGVYAGRADALSLQATIPALAARLADDGGSLLRAAQAVAAQNSRGNGGAVFTSIRGGLARLPQVLAAAGRFRVRTGFTVRSIRRTPSGFAVECGPVPRPELVESELVVCAAPAAKAAGMLRAVAPRAAAELAFVQAASVAIVTLAFQTRDLALPASSGLLVAAGEPFAVKGVTLLSQKWPGTPDDLAIIRASVGRAGDVRDVQREDSELVQLVRDNLRVLIGLDAAPIDAVVTRWGGGLPQYAVGHVERVSRIRSAVAEVGGLAVCGASYDGLGIPACIASASAAVEAALAGLRDEGE
jgi:protoporphyrinogen/coproporphyrinogen III oxidase